MRTSQPKIKKKKMRKRHERKGKINNLGENIEKEIQNEINMFN